MKIHARTRGSRWPGGRGAVPGVRALLLSMLAFAAATVPAARAQVSGGGWLIVGQVTGGGGRSAGGSYALAGSSAVPVCAVSAGRSFVLNGGLVGAYVVPTAGVTLNLVRVSFDEALLSWSAEAQAEGYVLESATALGAGAAWQPVVPAPTGPGLVVPMNQPARYYRLRKP